MNALKIINQYSVMTEVQKIDKIIDVYFIILFYETAK